MIFDLSLSLSRSIGTIRNFLLLRTKKIHTSGMLYIALLAAVILLPGQSWSSLQFVEAHYGGPVLDGACGLAVSPDGKHLYAAGYYDGVIAVFSRNSSTGALTFVAVYTDEIGGIDGIYGAAAITFSPDGSHLYVSGWLDDTLVTFTRSSDTGLLTFVEMQQDDTDGVDGLLAPYSLVVSADGGHVYVSGEYDNAVGVFARNSSTGQLNFVGMQMDRYDGADGLYGVVDVAVSADGKHLYAAGYDDDSVAVFARNSDTGALSFRQVARDNIDGVDGLDGVRTLSTEIIYTWPVNMTAPLPCSVWPATTIMSPTVLKRRDPVAAAAF